MYRMYRAIATVFLLGIFCLLPITAPALVLTDPTGGGQPHANVQPSLAINHIIALSGIYPSREKGVEPFIGEVTLFAGNFAPRGWALCDGQLLPIAENTALFSLLGTTYGGDGRTTFALPDLRGRTAIHPGSIAGGTDWRLGQKTGVEEVTLTVDQLPAHSHTIPSEPWVTDPTGGGQPHTNMQPSLALNHTIALGGIYPSRNKGVDPFIGEITLFAGNFAPRGWAMCDGQLLQISQNDALFSLLGTAYGGDGRTTFGLPDLRGRTPIHAGQGPGLTNRPWGATTGVEQVALTVGQMPAHNHALPPSSDETGYTGGSQAHTNMQPSLALHYMIAMQGVYPSRNKGAEPFLGEISLFAGNFAPRGWAFCDGQILPISQNEALFSLLGTIYGGDGRTTFGLPDLRGRVAVHPGTGPGLTTWHLGEEMGVENLAVGVAQMPAHRHSYVREPSILARQVFYNNSSFDDPAGGFTDDDAIATDKLPLLPGETATFRNYTSYSRGINGVIVDVADLLGTPTAADFQFKVGNDNNPKAWSDAPEPIDVLVRPGEGVDGSDRITILWEDNAIDKQWLQIVLKATDETGLLEDDVFYFGNAIGETGNSPSDAMVNAADMLGARDNPRSFLKPAPIDFPYDFDRDARVNATDMLIARDNPTHFLNALQLITVPGLKAAAVPEPSTLVLAAIAAVALVGVSPWRRKRAA